MEAKHREREIEVKREDVFEGKRMSRLHSVCVSLW